MTLIITIHLTTCLWILIPSLVCEDGENGIGSFSFDQAPANRIKESVTNAVAKELKNVYSHLKEHLVIEKRDGLIRVGYKKLCQFAFTAQGEFLDNCADDELLKNLTIEPQFFKDLLEAKRKLYF